MYTSISLALLLGSTLSSGYPSGQSKPQDCAPVHVITARGSKEDPGEGAVAPLTDLIVAANKGATREAVDYPALLLPYDDSSSKGTQAVTDQLTAYVDRCPDSKVVLVGYSQGAHIIGDSLCGGGGVLGIGEETTPPIDKSIGDKGAQSPC